MKALKAALGLLLFALCIGASASAQAWHHGGHARFGVYIGAPAYWYAPYPHYPYYPAYAYPPIVVAPAAPPVYIEQGSAPAATAPSPPQSQVQSNWWYYCADSKEYYPYAKDCPAGWQKVSPQPPQ